MSEKLLRFIRAYGHEMMNHLAVISGCVQLNKPERIPEYIYQVSAQIKTVNTVAKIASLEAAAAILGFYQHCLRYRVPLVVDIRTDLAGCMVSGESLASSLEEVFSLAGGLVVPLEGTSQMVKIVVDATDSTYLLELEIPIAELEHPLTKEELLFAGSRMRPFGGRVDFGIAKGQAVLSVSLPRREE
ncbi:MAG: Spo0B domain-containing protein [Bacillota bacterium]